MLVWAVTIYFAEKEDDGSQRQNYSTRTCRLWRDRSRWQDVFHYSGIEPCGPKSSPPDKFSPCIILNRILPFPFRSSSSSHIFCFTFTYKNLRLTSLLITCSETPLYLFFHVSPALNYRPYKFIFFSFFCPLSLSRLHSFTVFITLVVLLSVYLLLDFLYLYNGILI